MRPRGSACDRVDELAERLVDVDDGDLDDEASRARPGDRREVVVAEQQQLTADDVELGGEQRGTGDDGLRVGLDLVEHLSRRVRLVDQVAERPHHLRILMSSSRGSRALVLGDRIPIVGAAVRRRTPPPAARRCAGDKLLACTAARSIGGRACSQAGNDITGPQRASGPSWSRSSRSDAASRHRAPSTKSTMVG